MDDLVVNDKLTTAVIDNQSTNAASSIGEGVADAVEQIALVDDTEALLDVSGLGHGSDMAVVAQVEDTVGLVDGTQHALDNDGRRRVGDEAGLLLELAGEDVDTQVAVLTGLGRHGDTDDLARTALEDQQITNADEVAWNRDGVWRMTSTRADDANVLAATTFTGTAGAMVLGDVIFVPVGTFVMVVQRMQDAIGGALDTAAEGVVVAVVVVVAHLVARRLVVDVSTVGARLDVWLGASVS